MKKLGTVISYECFTSFKYIWIFYSVCFSSFAIIYLISGISSGDFGNMRTNGIELNSMIYIGIVGVLGFKEDFKMLIQNGFTRKYIFIATFSLFIFISFIMALVDIIAGNFLHIISSSNYNTIFGGLYGYGHPLIVNFIYLFLVYILICSTLYLSILIINKIGKKSSIYLAITLGALILLIPTLLKFVIPTNITKNIVEFIIKGFGFMSDGSLILIYPILLLISIIIILSLSSFLVIRRTELK